MSEESYLINVRGIELGGNMQLKTKEPIMLQKGLYSLHFFIRGNMMKDGQRSGAIELTAGSLLKKHRKPSKFLLQGFIRVI